MKRMSSLNRMGFVQDNHCVYENKWTSWQLNPSVVLRLASAGHKISGEDPQTPCWSRDTLMQWESLGSSATVCSHLQCSSTAASHGVTSFLSPTPLCWALQWVHHQLHSMARKMGLTSASGPSYQVRLGFRALLTSLCYNVSVLSALALTVAHSLSLCASSSSSFSLLLQ